MTPQAVRATSGLALTIVGLVLCSIRPASSQEITLIVGDDTECACRVDLERLVTLGAEDGPGSLLGEIRQIGRNSVGIFHVLAWQEHQIYRFSPDGEPLSSLFTRGEGPGEALSLNHFVFRADTLFAFDRTTARMTVVDPNGRVVRTAPIAASVNHGFATEEHILLNARVSGERVYGVPLHRVAYDGAVLRSFGGQGVVRMDAPRQWIRWIAPAAQGGVWSAYDNQPVIEHWSADGEHLGSVERSIEWFQPYLNRTWGGPDEPIVPWTKGLTVDGRGYLKTITLRAGPHWAERLGPPVRNAVGDLVYPAGAGLGLFESVIEIIDPRAGQLIASGVFEQELYGFVDPDHVYSYVEEPFPQVSIWRLRLVGIPPGETSSTTSMRR